MYLVSPCQCIVSLFALTFCLGFIDQWHFRKNYSPQRAYAQSKLAQMMFTITLNERMAKQGVLALAVHPGVVATELFQHVAWAKTFPRLASTFLKASYSNDFTLSNCSHFHIHVAGI